MSTIGIRHLRRHAAELVRRAAAGETIIITVSGQEVAELGPVHPRSWRAGADVAAIFSGPADEHWAADLETLDGSPLDPFRR